MCLCVPVLECAYECSIHRRPEEGAGSLGAGVTGYCELPEGRVGNQTEVLCRNSMCS